MIFGLFLSFQYAIRLPRISVICTLFFILSGNEGTRNFIAVEKLDTSFLRKGKRAVELQTFFTGQNDR